MKKEKQYIFSHVEHVHTSVTCTICGAMVCADKWSMSKHEEWHALTPPPESLEELQD